MNHDAYDLVEHILSLVPRYPFILDMATPFDLFRIGEYKPSKHTSMTTAALALKVVQQKYLRDKMVGEEAEA